MLPSPETDMTGANDHPIASRPDRPEVEADAVSQPVLEEAAIRLLTRDRVQATIWIGIAVAVLVLMFVLLGPVLTPFAAAAILSLIHI